MQVLSAEHAYGNSEIKSIALSRFPTWELCKGVQQNVLTGSMVKTYLSNTTSDWYLESEGKGVDFMCVPNIAIYVLSS